ncbi:hypothetical protein JCGZ_25172 [Jatropha curcas]|uniref:DNA-binding protein BIN4 n=1 Tax=Jatropha curcas TaxID=180498 RepID=A0A067JLM3_JATCU|nr:hypothetical protein JCGZ_25172 [Jatropha curcas]
MSSSREDSPDWLRCFQAPTRSTLILSSDSDSLPNVTPSRDVKIESQSTEGGSNHDIVPSENGAESPSNKISKAKAPKRAGSSPKRKRKKEERQGNGVDALADEEGTSDKHAANHSVWALSSDSESYPDNSSRRETKNSQLKESVEDEDAVVGSSVKSPSKKTLKEKFPKKLLKAEGHTVKKEKNKTDNVLKKGDHDDAEVADEDTSEKHTGPQVSSTRLPLMLSEKVNRSKALVECEGESIDLSGDMGAVGRVVFPDTSNGNHDMYLDLKGTIYRTTIVPSRTFCVVSFGQSEAKIEAIMNDFIQLKAQSNVYEAETMVEGTLEGFSFDSEDEVDRMPKAISHHTDQNEGNEEQTNGKTKRKAEKSFGGQKKSKTGGGKPQPGKRARNKAQASKKTKTKK